MFFPVVMCGCERWTIKKAEIRRIDSFDQGCWRRLLRVPWTASRSNQLILKEISPEYSLEGLMLKLKLQYFDYLMWRTDPLEKILMLGKIEGRRRRGWQRMKWLDGIAWLNGHEFEQTQGDSEGQESLVGCSPQGRKESDATQRLNNNYHKGQMSVLSYYVQDKWHPRDFSCGVTSHGTSHVVSTLITLWAI